MYLASSILFRRAVCPRFSKGGSAVKCRGPVMKIKRLVTVSFLRHLEDSVRAVSAPTIDLNSYARSISCLHQDVYCGVPKPRAADLCLNDMRHSQICKPL